MYKILEKTQFSEKVFKFRIEAPQMAKHAHAGQFLMVRANECGERVPFTFADCLNSSRGCDTGTTSYDYLFHVFSFETGRGFLALICG